MDGNTHTWNLLFDPMNVPHSFIQKSSESRVKIVFMSDHSLIATPVSQDTGSVQSPFAKMHQEDAVAPSLTEKWAQLLDSSRALPQSHTNGFSGLGDGRGGRWANWDVWLVGQEGSCVGEMFLSVAIAFSTPTGAPPPFTCIWVGGDLVQALEGVGFLKGLLWPGSALRSEIAMESLAFRQHRPGDGVQSQMLAEVGVAPKPLGAMRASVATLCGARVRRTGTVGGLRTLVLLGTPDVPATSGFVPATMGSQVGRTTEGLAAFVAAVLDPGNAGTAVLGQGERARVGLLAQLTDKGPQQDHCIRGPFLGTRTGFLRQRGCLFCHGAGRTQTGRLGGARWSGFTGRWGSRVQTPIEVTGQQSGAYQTQGALGWGPGFWQPPSFG